ncbi:MAG: polyprenyl synthetase family protein [Pseudomonadota bacterium]
MTRSTTHFAKASFDLAGYLTRQRERVNLHLASIMTGISPSRLRDAMQYSLLAGGKRFRPVLCLAAAEAVGNADRDVLIAACALECIHTYSLIHDDLPAMDDDDLRRGRPTCHRAFDEATAVLAGDGLLTLAFELLSDAAERSQQQNAARWCRVIHAVARGAGHAGMIEGQMRDMAAEGRRLDLDALEQLHRLKTGALIRVSVETGATLAGADPSCIAALSAYAEQLGLAFQVTDDVLNETGNPHTMGKAVGTDKDRQKSTYPALMGLTESSTHAARLIDNALKCIGHFDNRAEPLRALATYILHRQR